MGIKVGDQSPSLLRGRLEKRGMQHTCAGKEHLVGGIRGILERVKEKQYVLLGHKVHFYFWEHPGERGKTARAHK